MDARLQLRVQRYGWDKAASHYENHWQRQLKPAQDLLMQMADLQLGEKVIDIACGTGLVTFRAAQIVGDAGHVTGTDISDKMVEAAVQRAQELRIKNVSFTRSGAEELNFSEGSFGVALCALGLMYVVEPLEALNVMKRILKPGGRAVSAVWGARKNCGWAGIFPVVDARVKSEVCPMFFQLGTGDTLANTYREAGFTDIHSERINTILHYDSADVALGAAFAGGPVAMAYSRFDEKTKIEAHHDYLATIETYRDDNGYHVPGEFVVTSGVKA